MKIARLNPPHRAIDSRVPKGQLPPLGHLAMGGPLIDAGHAVRLINADPAPMTDAGILEARLNDPPGAALIGHAGSTSAHPVVARLTPLIRAA